MQLKRPFFPWVAIFVQIRAFFFMMCYSYTVIIEMPRFIYLFWVSDFKTKLVLAVDIN